MIWIQYDENKNIFSNQYNKNLYFVRFEKCVHCNLNGYNYGIQYSAVFAHGIVCSSFMTITSNQEQLSQTEMAIKGMKLHL